MQFFFYGILAAARKVGPRRRVVVGNMRRLESFSATENPFAYAGFDSPVLVR